MEFAIYLYCVTDGDPPDEPIPGVDEAAAVVWIPHEDIRAVVSRVSLAEFSAEAIERNVRSLEWVEAKVRRHEAVIERAMERGAVLPMKFATIFLSEERVRELLAAHCASFRDRLHRLRGREEWGVKVYADPGAFFHLQMKEEVAALAAELARQTPGRAFMLRRKAERDLREERDRRITAAAARIHSRLCDAAERSVQNELVRPARDDERMVLNAAYLVSREQKPVFLDAVESLRQEWEGAGLRLVCTGPWPPYHFAADEGEKK